VDAKKIWGAGQRLMFIEFRLWWEGRINRADLIEKFGISPQQASADIQEYVQSVQGEGVDYDRSGKFYFATKVFRPKLYPDDASQYLNELMAVGLGSKEYEHSFLGFVPAFGVTPTVARRVSTEVLLGLLQAIRARHAIQIRYQSFSSPEPKSRWIEPHALAFDGHRWHVRAYAETSRGFSFSDFVLARIIEVGEIRPATVDSSTDTEWHTLLSVRIGAHSDLDESMKRRIEWDYCMEKGERTLTVRAALMFYFLKQFRLDVDSEKLSPKARQIVLLNTEQLAQYRGS
jgi:hypothetical protein